MVAGDLVLRWEASASMAHRISWTRLMNRRKGCIKDNSPNYQYQIPVKTSSPSYFLMEICRNISCSYTWVAIMPTPHNGRIPYIYKTWKTPLKIQGFWQSLLLYMSNAGICSPILMTLDLNTSLKMPQHKGQLVSSSVLMMQTVWLSITILIPILTANVSCFMRSLKDSKW